MLANKRVSYGWQATRVFHAEGTEARNAKVARLVQRVAVGREVDDDRESSLFRYFASSSLSSFCWMATVVCCSVVRSLLQPDAAPTRRGLDP
jgi:hypothetical protein